MSTKLFIIGVLAAVLLAGPSIAEAVDVSPIAVTDFSGEVHPVGFGPGLAIDGELRTFSVILTDTAAPDDCDDGVTFCQDVQGHMVFDMGSAAGPIAGVLFTSRLQAPPPLNPEDVSFFYYGDDDPFNNALVDDIEGDDDIILIATHTFAGLIGGEEERVAWTGGPNVRYIGMRIDSGYEPKGNYQIGEITFDVIPEPATLALLSLGALGVLVRQRKEIIH